jgi:hypothetical protein
MRKTWLAVVFGFAIAAAAFAQSTAAATRPKVDNEFVHQQFGMEFTLVEEVGTAFGDLDGDGVEDAVIAARCKNPMIDQDEHSYRVVDPLNSFYGYGDPKMTTTFSEGNPALRGLVVLVIHGTGPESWHAAKPKAKFVIVNLPYRTISVRKMKMGKKTIEALYVKEAGYMDESSAIFYDGKKFHYVPMGGEME